LLDALVPICFRVHVVQLYAVQDVAGVHLLLWTFSKRFVRLVRSVEIEHYRPAPP
jgi:hypothetical protein